MTTSGGTRPSRASRWRAGAAGLVALGLLAGACADDDTKSADETEASHDTDAPDPTVAPDDTGDATTTDDAPTTTVERTTTTATTVAPTLPTSPSRTTVDPTKTTQPGGVEAGTFFDDFEDDANGWAPERLDDEFATGEIVDGFLTFAQNASFNETLPEGDIGTPIVLWPPVLDASAPDLTDVRVGATVAMTRGASAGLACGIDPTAEDERFYSFSVSTSGVVAIQKFTSGRTFETLAQNPQDASDTSPGPAPTLPAIPAFEYDADAGYAVAIECLLGDDRAQLSLELDGEQLLTVQDTEDPISSGIAGVQYSESQLMNLVEGFQPFGVVFDTFMLVDLNAGTGAPKGPGAFESECVDDAGDMEDDKGNPISDLDSNGADLVQVNLSSDGSVMTVVWELAAEPPTDLTDTERGDVRWFLNISRGDGEVILIRVRWDGSELEAIGDDDLAAADSVELTTVSLSGTTVAVDVPLDQVEIPDEFEWSAFGELSRFEIDRCPEAVEQIPVP